MMIIVPNNLNSYTLQKAKRKNINSLTRLKRYIRAAPGKCRVPKLWNGALRRQKLRNAALAGNDAHKYVVLTRFLARLARFSTVKRGETPLYIHIEIKLIPVN